jgi:hypothetical protein
MSDYRDPRDPMYGTWALIAGVLCLVFILGLGLALGVGYGPPTRVASHNAAPPQQTTAPAIPPTTPGLAPPPSQAPNRP